MTADVQAAPGNVYVHRISGVLKRPEFENAQRDIARSIDAGAVPRLLLIFEHFEGWEHGADWNDLDFFSAYGNKIAKIAIVSEPRWEAELAAFAGAGFSSTPVKFFSLTHEPEARTWLDERGADS